MKRVSEEVIGCAMTVSNSLGTGFLETVYENALCLELRAAGVVFEQQKALQVVYQNTVVGKYFADILIDERLIVEVKALARLTSEHEAQVMNYLKSTGLTVGLLLNFGRPRLEIKRVVIHHDDSKPI